jgi:hypothetical protein
MQRSFSIAKNAVGIFPKEIAHSRSAEPHMCELFPLARVREHDLVGLVALEFCQEVVRFCAEGVSSHDVLEPSVGFVMSPVEGDSVGEPVVPEAFHKDELFVVVWVELDELAVEALASSTDAHPHGSKFDLCCLYPWGCQVKARLVQLDRSITMVALNARCAHWCEVHAHQPEEEEASQHAPCDDLCVTIHSVVAEACCAPISMISSRKV